MPVRHLSRWVANIRNHEYTFTIGQMGHEFVSIVNDGVQEVVSNFKNLEMAGLDRISQFEFTKRHGHPDYSVLAAPAPRSVGANA